MLSRGRTVALALGVMLISIALLRPTAVAANGSSDRAMPPTAVAGASHSVAKSAVIDGSIGGTLQVASWTLVVPPGAFAGSATVTATASGLANQIIALGITPDALNHFMVPVKLQYRKVAVNENVDGEAIYWWNPDTRAWEVVPNQTDIAAAGTILAPLSHFSYYCVGSKAGW